MSYKVVSLLLRAHIESVNFLFAGRYVYTLENIDYFPLHYLVDLTPLQNK
jgi:hypothetical protein